MLTVNSTALMQALKRSWPRAKIVIQPFTRLMSLDTFRGITIAAMLLVNHPGDNRMIYGPLRHAEWHGWTPTDLIFPFFLFIVGVALTFSLRRQHNHGAGSGRILARAAKRGLTLIGLGLLIASFPWSRLQPSMVRIPGVLQRIGLAYMAATSVVLWSGVQGQAIIMSSLLLGYWALLSWVPVPGVGAGVWEPGQDIGAYIDRAFFGINHLWPGTWDPEGLLSTLPAVGTVLLGALAGQWLQSDINQTRKTIGMLVVGAFGVVLGLLWSQVFPINKNLWTSSFTIFTAGMALILLAGCYWLVDVKNYRRSAYPFVILGVNGITVYVLSELVHGMLARTRIQSLGISSLWKAIYEYLFASWLSPYNASLAFAIAYALVWFALVAVLYKKDIRVHV